MTRTGVVVVTVVHGRHDHLAAQHASLADAPPDHVVVVAMGDPEVHAVVEAGPLSSRATVIELPVGDRLPLAQARNTGVAAALELGDLVVLLDVDCLASPGLLASYASAADDHDGLLCGPVAYLPEGHPVSDAASIAPHPARPAPPAGVVERAEDLRLFWSLSFALDAATWTAIDGFDEGYEGYGGEDTDFGQRAAAAGVPMWWVGGATAYHQWHPVSSPPVEHLDDVVRNANRFHARWGWFPMEGWLAAFEERGLAALVGEEWRVVEPGSRVVEPVATTARVTG